MSYYIEDPRWIDPVMLAFMRRYPQMKQTGTVEDSEFFFPSGYDYVEKQVTAVPTDPLKVMFAIENMDTFVSKRALWLILCRHYGRVAASEIHVECFTDPQTIVKVAMDDPDEIFVVKKDIQRQLGVIFIRGSQLCRLYTSPSLKNMRIVVCQRLMRDPLLVKEHKVNLRVYVLLVMTKEQLRVYAYNDGFVYYTPLPYAENGESRDTMVTTGYVDRSVYESRPLTHKDLYGTLNGGDAAKLRSRILTLVRRVLTAYGKNIFRNRFHTSFHLFGMDVHVHSDLSVRVVEVNKSPDLSPKDGRDGELKKRMVEEVVDIVSNDTCQQRRGFQLVL